MSHARRLGKATRQRLSGFQHTLQGAIPRHHLAFGHAQQHMIVEHSELRNIERLGELDEVIESSF